MTDSTQPALVLDTTVAQSEPVHFAGFPGLWLEGQPIAVSQLGFADADEAWAKVEELGLPLAETTVSDGEGLMPEVPNHVPAGEVPVFAGDELVDVVEAPAPVDPFAEAVAPAAADLIPALASIDDLDHINGMLAAENAGKQRVTVVSGLAARAAELTPPDTEVTP